MPILKSLSLSLDVNNCCSRERGRLGTPAGHTYPLNVGADGWCGHRTYGDVPWLVDPALAFVAHLDEDNWYCYSLGAHATHTHERTHVHAPA